MFGCFHLLSVDMASLPFLLSFELLCRLYRLYVVYAFSRYTPGSIEHIQGILLYTAGHSPQLFRQSETVLRPKTCRCRINAKQVTESPCGFRGPNILRILACHRSPKALSHMALKKMVPNYPRTQSLCLYLREQQDPSSSRMARGDFLATL